MKTFFKAAKKLPYISLYIYNGNYAGSKYQKSEETSFPFIVRSNGHLENKMGTVDSN